LARFDNISLFQLVTMAYGILPSQLLGPEWLSATHFDINARVPPGTTREQYRLMLQNLLVERFKMAVHHETKEMQTYELTVGKNGPKLKAPAQPDGPGLGLQPPPGPISPPAGYTGPVILTRKNETTEWLATFLAAQVGQPVVDNTGLKGNYDISLRWGTAPSDVSADDSEPTLFSALQEQLGLKLTPQKGLVDILVIDHIEKEPTEN
jgi:uncharacterized protein (TIGR03435 family)